MGDYIRVFASTDGGAVSNVALEYVRSLIRAAPIRLISVSGLLDKSWMIFERLLTTDMSGRMLANVVITEPQYWVKQLKIPMPKRNPMAEMIAARSSGQFSSEERAQAPRPGSVEVAESTVELYTAGVRNVIVLASAIRSPVQIKAALRYEAAITPNRNDAAQGSGELLPLHIGAPVQHHNMLKAVVLGPSPEKEI